MNISLSAFWRAWHSYMKDKVRSSEFNLFYYNLEANLYQLCWEVENGIYRHGEYTRFTVTDNKRRQITVASIRDRVLHRLVYDYLTDLYDPIFYFDVWSSRKNKGLQGCIERIQFFAKKYQNGYVWKCDIKKFFDNVDHAVLSNCIKRHVRDIRALRVCDEIIMSYHSEAGPGKGIPIGNVTSQILSNIYLHEFDRYVCHYLKPKAYIRYGDDFLLFCSNKAEAIFMREYAIQYLSDHLHLSINGKNDMILEVAQGIYMLGVWNYLGRIRLNKRNRKRLLYHSNAKNASSYRDLVRRYGDYATKQAFNWILAEQIENL